jgi:rod shape determining protein RodA
MTLDLPWIRHWRFTGSILLLCLFGVAMIYSAGVKNIPSPAVANIWIRQAVVLAGSIVVLMALSRIHPRWFEWMAMPLYIMSTALLAVTLVIGTGSGAAEGVRSFIRIWGFQFQPAEAAKVVTALALAKLLARQPDGPAHLRDILKPMLLVAVPLALVVLQPDLGTALAFIGMLFAAIYWAGTPWQLMLFAASPGFALILSFDTRLWSAYFILLVIALYLHRYRLYLVESLSVVVANLAAGAIAQPLWNSLAQYQRNRILVFLDPEIDPQGAGWQRQRSETPPGTVGTDADTAL